MTTLLEQAFDPQQFRQQAHKTSDLLSSYLSRSLYGEADRVFQRFDPEELYTTMKHAFGSDDMDIEQWFRQITDSSIHLHNPGYLGHQVTPVLPLAALADFVGSLLNNGMGVYEMGSPTVAMERVVIKEMAALAGFGEEADGFLTSGGTLGNMTALLTARQVKAGYDVWNSGIQQDEPPIGIMVSEEAHYSISRAARILGLGEQGIVKVPVDEHYRMNPDHLSRRYREAADDGIKVIAVVGNACSTATGSFDPLPAIADFCHDRDLWFHVDAAHGGGALFSDRHRPLLDGLGRADSVIIDFHKLLMCPALVTAVIYKRGGDAFRTFAQKAYYLWSEEQESEWHNLGRRTFECTKTMMALKAYLVMKEYGKPLFEEAVDTLFQRARDLADLISEQPEFELFMRPSANIVCFRHRPVNAEDLNTHNERLREKLIAEGRYYLVQTRIVGQTYLRCTIMNPFTRKDHLESMLDRLGRLSP